MFTEADIQSSAKVCVIGKTIVDNLFPDGSDPVGHVIRFNKIPFQIVGVLESKGYNSMGMDQDDVVLAPYTTVMKRILAITYLNGIYASALSEDMTDYATEEISTILRREHRLKDSDEDDFTIRSQQELSQYVEFHYRLDDDPARMYCRNIVDCRRYRYYEYHVCVGNGNDSGNGLAVVGARGIDILSQFLIEAILISITGGIIGVLIGCGASWVVKNIAHWPIYIQPWSIFLSFAVCTVTGIFFGWYPAKKAADLDPIDAIRYE